MMLNRTELSAYLQLGYVPRVRPDWRQQPWMTDRTEICRRLQAMSEAELLEEGRRALFASFRDIDAGAQIVPLSGGFDSRLVLGALLEHVEASRVSTITLGSPGTFDYEFGQRVARAVGVKNMTVDVSKVPWDRAALMRYAARFESPIPFFYGWLFEQLWIHGGREATYWSGLMGDVLAGHHLTEQESGTWDDATRAFIAWNRLTRSMSVIALDVRLTELFPDDPLVPNEQLEYGDQLNFNIRQYCFNLATGVHPERRVRLPFMQSAWVQYILSAGRPNRVDKRWLRKFCSHTFPDLFRLPLKKNCGLGAQAKPWQVTLRRQMLRVPRIVRRLLTGYPGVHPITNYVDFNIELRRREDLQQVALGALRDSVKRGAVDWVDPLALWDAHQQGRAHHANALLMLAGLELWLQAREGKSA